MSEIIKKEDDRIVLIVAHANNFVIGRDNKMPWHIPEELKHFKQLTLKRPMLMGVNTAVSIGKPLPGRHNIVVTRNESRAKFLRELGFIVFDDLQTAYEGALAISDTQGLGRTCTVIGGEKIYEQFYPLADVMYVSHIQLQVEGDAFFPNYGNSIDELGEKWRVQALTHHKETESTPSWTGYRFVRKDSPAEAAFLKYFKDYQEGKVPDDSREFFNIWTAEKQ